MYNMVYKSSNYKQWPGIVFDTVRSRSYPNQNKKQNKKKQQKKKKKKKHLNTSTILP